MWEHVSITLVTAWDIAEWRCVARWRDDDVSESVTLVKSGHIAITPNDAPEVMLRHAVEQAVLQGLADHP